MSAALRLGAFAAGLTVVFGVAYAGGHAAGPQRGLAEPAPAADAHGMAGMGDGEHGGADPVRGLAVSEGGLTLRLARSTAPVGRPTTLSFRITDGRGQTIRDFDVEHTKRMHFIVVRRDLTGFQHLHPRQLPDGSWTTDLTLARAGNYRVFADFSRGGTPRTLAADLAVDGDFAAQPLPAPAAAVDVDGLKVTRVRAASGSAHGESLAFRVTRRGRPVRLEDYLGAKGHLVALREGDLAFLHVHPDEDRLRFAAEFPSAGRYRLFLQFQAGGVVHTAAFTEEVER